MIKPVYVIGEIGQNHNGSVDIAMQLIDMVAIPFKDELFGRELKPMDAVKLTKRDLNEELSHSAMMKPYDNPNSFGKTYGEHRAALELDEAAHAELFRYAKSKGLDVVETLCAKGCLSMLKFFTPDKLKVASRDLTNLPLLEAMAETQIPMILSTGMGGELELNNALEIITKYHSDISILHCLSEYPSDYKNVNLNTIRFLQKHYGKYTIGYSDHTLGIMAPVAAVAMGAKIVEKHITLDRNMKGTDHKGSLGPEGIWRMMRDIRNLELALGEEAFFVSDASKMSSVKLERSIATLRAMRKGEIIREEDLHLLSPGDGFKWAQLGEVTGKKLNADIAANEIIYRGMLE